MLKKASLILLMGAALLIGLGSALFKGKETNGSNSAFSSLGGEFTLNGVDGPVSLSDFRDDKLVLMFFGFTHCPDVCPISLTNVARAMKQLTPEQAEQVQGMFVSLDPERDTPTILSNYVSFFNESFVGVTGTKEQVDKVVQQYGAVYRIVELEDSAMGYSVDHSSRLYLIDKKGELVKLLYHDSKPEEIAQAIVATLAQ
ncbi:SCO family protein [Marinomonas sp. PE14-40]|uniref:SCO family protein n=1 Tax=Marinomonas sp. PE14-40 TaxID=3060621 RepID=UPI003F668911